MKSLLYIAIVLLCIVTGCKKDEDKSLSKRELLTQKPWTPTKAEDKLQNGTWSTVAISACEVDDQYWFKPSGVMELASGTICPEATDASSTWTLTANDTKLTIDTDTYEVSELTETTLVATGSVNRITFKH